MCIEKSVFFLFLIDQDTQTYVQLFKENNLTLEIKQAS